jgi:NADH-quinone oxidoreductase subunit N
MSSLHDLKLFLPETILISGILFILCADLLAMNAPSVRRKIALGITLAAFALAGLALLGLHPSSAGAVSIFSGMAVVDSFSVYFKWLFLVAGALVAILSYSSREVERPQEGEFFALLLALTLGMFLLAGATHCLMILLSIEFLSISSYVLTAFKRNDPKSTEAALKYVVYGALASGIMLFGFSYLYGLTGQLDIREIGRAIAGLLAHGGQASEKLIGSIALVMVFAGFAYKIAAVPFHMWCPDVYQGAPTPVTALLSVGPKAAGFAVLIRFFTTVVGFAELPWPALFGLAAAATMTLGNLAAIRQENVKRLLAYSSIAHAGYMLMGVSAFTPQGMHSVMLYLAVYLLMNLGAFLVVMAVRDSTGREDLAAYRGLSQTRPLLAVTMTVFLFSLAGLPPLGGFVAKFYIFAALLQKAGPWYDLLALVGVINSAISLYYYARIVRVMFLTDAEEGIAAPRPVALLYRAVMLLLAVPVLFLGVYWGPLQAFAARSALVLNY